MGPLATFNAKIELAYLVKIVTKECRRQLHLIRRIRNKFAHTLEPITFEDAQIKDMCGHLISVADAPQFLVEQLSIELTRELFPSYFTTWDLNLLKKI